MGDRIQDYYARLGLPVSASFEEIKSAYRQLVKQWHPDQFCHDPQQQQRADEFIKQINEAYDYFKLQSQGSLAGSVYSASSSSTTHRTRKTSATEHYERGVVFAKAGQYTDALDAFSMAIRLNAAYAEAYQYRGFIYSVLGYEHRANSDLRKAKDLQSSQAAPAAQSHPKATTVSSDFSSPTSRAVREPSWHCTSVLVGHRDTISATLFSRDRRVLISSSWDGQIRLWNLKTAETFGTLEQGEAIYAIALSPEGEHVASAGRDGKIHLWHWKTGSLLRTLQGHSSTVRSLAFTPNRRQLISGSFDHTLKLWDIQRGEVLHTFSGHTAPVWAVGVNPDGQTLVSGGEDQQIRVWNLQTRQLIKSYPCAVKEIRAIASHPNRQDVVLGTSDRALLHFNLQKQTLSPLSFQHEQGAWSVVVDPSGQWNASGGDDQQVKVWKMGEPPETLTGHGTAVRSVAFSPDGKVLASAGLDQVIRLWAENVPSS